MAGRWGWCFQVRGEGLKKQVKRRANYAHISTLILLVHPEQSGVILNPLSCEDPLMANLLPSPSLIRQLTDIASFSPVGKWSARTSLVRSLNRRARRICGSIRK